jgi:hypothetical protein
MSRILSNGRDVLTDSVVGDRVGDLAGHGSGQ